MAKLTGSPMATPDNTKQTIAPKPCASGLNENQIDQETGLVCQQGQMVRFWWADQFDGAKKLGCHLEDSCGVFPPFYLNAEYCGEPQTICPGQHWQPGLPR